MAGQFEGKVALVTGASSGIGRASALAFAGRGAKVVIGDVAVKRGEETVDMVKEIGGDALWVKTDVSQAVEVEAMVNKAVETYGRLDFAFNNAGILRGGLIHEYTEENWNRVIDVNLKGIWLCLKYEIPQMLKQGGGAIVNTSSSGGLVGLTSDPVYSASKHGVVGLTKSAALQYAKEGIRINALCPGPTLSPPMQMLIERQPEMEPELISKEPMGRWGDPKEIAEAAVWLCSDAASFVTGHAMSVDGGSVVQ